MIRRARLSFKPNVRPGGRSVGSGAPNGASQPEEPVQPGDISVTAGPEENDKSIGGGGGSTLCAADPGEVQRNPDIPIKAAAASSENEPSKPASAPIQRRKRISTLPNLAKPRVSSSAPVTSSQKPQQVESPPSLPVSSVPSKDEVSSPEKAKVPSSAKSQGPSSSPQGLHLTLPEKRTPVPHVPQFSPLKKLKQPEITPVKSVDCTSKEDFSPLKERPSQKSSPNECKKYTPKKLVATGNLEKERLRRAQKLRRLLRDELRKERKEWKAKHPVVINTEEAERSKMLMRDFIYFIPASNPMTSSFVETKSSDKSCTDSQLSGTPVKNISNDEEDDLDEEDDESQLLAPRVKVAEDGSIILDEESLTVEVARSKAPIVEGNDPIFERGSTTTYSSFRKSNYSKPWSDEETDMFFLAISMVGTDFSMIGQLFPHRERIEIKNKFKREERQNSWRIDKAFREKTTFDLEFFSNRLERALEASRRKRSVPKVRQPHEKKAAKPRKKQKDKASTEEILSDGETAILSDDEGADSRTEEKENEGSVSVKECLLSSDNVPAKKRKNRKKNKEEEETCELLSEDTVPSPKKPRKNRAASDQVKDSELAVNDENLEDVQAASDTVQEKKKKSRKKKSTDKEMENTEDGGIVDVQSPQLGEADKTSTSSALPEVTNVLTCSESREPSFIQPEADSCTQESSVLLFTEESDCFSDLNISSIQESLGIIPGSQTDQTGNLDVAIESSQEDSVFETSHHLTSDSSKQVPLEEDLAADSHAGAKVEGSTESQKDSPAGLTRSRLQRPRPNLPMQTLARQNKVLFPERDDVTEERNEVTASNSQSHREDISAMENHDSKAVTRTPRKGDIPDPVQKHSPSGSSKVQSGHSDIDPPESPDGKADISKEKPPIRGRLVRPKPNLKKALTKDRPTELRSDSGEIATVPHTINEEALVKEKAESSTTSQEQCTKSTIKPAPLVHGRLQRPKPNTLRASKKVKCEDQEDPEKCVEVSAEDVDCKLASCVQDDTACGKLEEQDKRSAPEDTCLDSTQDFSIPNKETLSKPCISVQEIIPEPDPSRSPVSQVQSKKSPIKLARGQLQRPKPNLLKSRGNKGISKIKAEEKADVTSEDTGEDLDGSKEEHSDLTKEVPTADESSEHQENRVKPAEMRQDLLSRDLKPVVGANLPVEVQKPSKPAVLTRGRLQRPKPNLGRALLKRGVLSSSEDSKNESEVETFEKPPDATQAAKRSSECKAEEASDLGEDITFTEDNPQSSVQKTTNLPVMVQGGSKESHSMPVTDSAHASINESCGFEDDKSASPTKPALMRSRFQRPKPNLGSSLTCPRVSTPQKCDPHEGRRRDDLISTSSIENLSQCDAGNEHILSHTDTEETAYPEELTQSYILPLESIVMPGVDQMDNEDAAATIKKDLSTSEDEQTAGPSPAMTRNRLQRPKPNLARSVKRPAVSTPLKADVHEESKTARDSIDISIIEKSGISRDKPNVDLSNESDIHLGTEEAQEDSAQLKDASCTREQTEGSNAKPLRNRLQKPKPNLGRASLRKESRVFSPEQEEVNFDSSRKIPEHLESKEGPGLAPIKDAAGGVREESTHTTIKPAQLRRSRLVRPVPSLGKSTNNRPSTLQDKTVKEGEASSSDKDLEVSSSKRKATECLPDVSTKRSCPPDMSKSPSDSASDQPPSTSAFHDSNKSSEKLEDQKQQHSRFGRLLKRPVSTTPPVASKPSENASECPEKEKTSRIVKPGKSKVAKPMSSKGKGKTTLVKLRAVSQDDEDDDEDDAALEFEEEDYDVSPDKLNQAPVFVPFSLRSPKPVPAEIEETVEEFEIPEDLGVSITSQSLGPPSLTLQDVSQHVPVSQAGIGNKGHCDGSTEAAMTLISMGNPVFQSKLGEPLDSDQCTESLITDRKLEVSTSSVQMVCAAEDDTTSNASAVTVCQEPLGFQERNGAVSADRLPEDGASGEETTFILTLVEIPISEGFSYPCAGGSADVLPAPVLITSGSSQALPPDQSSGKTASTDPSSTDSGPFGQGESRFMQSPPSRKRSISHSSEEEKPQPSKKPLLCTKQGEDHRSNTAACEENEKIASKLAEIKTEEKQDCHQSSSDIASPTTREVKGAECTANSTRLSTMAHVKKPATTSYDSSSRLSPPSSSTTQQPRPGRKPLGFVSLVCKEKQSKKTKVTSKKKSSKPKCGKAKIQEPEEQDPTRIHEDSPSSEVPSHSSSSTSTPTNAETFTSNSQASESLDNPENISQESPKSQDVATEEEAAEVSQYFFSDIFMEVDD